MEPPGVLRVLVVDDNAADSMIAGAAVSRAASGPYVLLHAASAAHALEQIQSQDVHLVLLDLNLPDSRGLDTLHKVRAATTCPVIVVSVDDAPGLHEAVLEAGAFEFLHKGRIAVDDFARLLRMAGARRRL